MKIKTLILKVLLLIGLITFAQFTTCNYFPITLEFDYFLLSTVCVYSIGIILYKLLFRLKQFERIDYLLFFMAVLFLIVIAAIADPKYFNIPQYFPLFPIFVGGLVVLLNKYWNKKLLIIPIALLLAFIGDKFIIEPIHFRQSFNNNTLTTLDVNAEEFSFFTPQGDTLLLNTKKYNTIVLDIAFFSCLPCRQLRPVMKKLQEKYRKDSTVLFLNINPVDPVDFIKSHYDTADLPVWIPIQPKEFKEYFKVDGYPKIIILAKSGKTIQELIGFNKTYEDQFIELIDENIKLNANEFISTK